MLSIALEPTAPLAARRADLEAALARPDRLVAIEAALPDLLRDGGDALLEVVARGLAKDAATPAGRRVLETVARSSAAARPVALAALRGAPAPAPAALPLPLPVPAADSRLPTPVSRLPSPDSRLPSPAPPDPAPAADWAAPFETALADPSAENLQAAALALVELADARPPAAAAKALAGRFAVAALDHEGAVQQGLSRLARGLKALG